VIVQPDRLLNRPVSLGEIHKGIIQAILQFQNTIDPLGHGVVVTVTHLAHRRANVVLSQQVSIGLAGILEAVVTVMDQASQGLSGLGNGHLHRPGRPVQGQRGTQVIAHNPAGVQTGDQGQVDKAAFSGQVSDITDPGLIGPGDNGFPSKFSQRQLPAQVVR